MLVLLGWFVGLVCWIEYYCTLLYCTVLYMYWVVSNVVILAPKWWGQKAELGHEQGWWSWVIVIVIVIIIVIGHKCGCTVLYCTGWESWLFPQKNYHQKTVFWSPLVVKIIGAEEFNIVSYLLLTPIGQTTGSGKKWVELHALQESGIAIKIVPLVAKNATFDP